MQKTSPTRITKTTVVIGLLGSILDAGFHQERWKKWRPSVSLAQHAELPIARFELLYLTPYLDIARCVAADVARVSPNTQVRLTAQEVKNPWDFEEVYGGLHDFARAYPFQTEQEDYLVHITTGTHVQQICLFLLTESRYFPARLIQTSPVQPRRQSSEGNHSIIDLDLSRYDRLADRFQTESRQAVSVLKSGIETRNQRFNQLMEQLEHVAIHSREPILLMGPTGSGKSRLARRIHDLKKSRHQIGGNFVEVNCATIRGDSAMSTLFGHLKGAFTGAVRDRPGLLREADGGLLFLDEVGELGSEEQAMLLRALEDKRFLPLGGDREVSSDFRLICGTNRVLSQRVAQGQFREDLLARIKLWTFNLPALTERPEDIEPNLDYELEQWARDGATRVTMSREVRERFISFATSTEARWLGNFRDLNASVIRMATWSTGGRITASILDAELDRLRSEWKSTEIAEPSLTGYVADPTEDLKAIISAGQLATMDLFDRAQLAFVVGVCRRSASLSDAGRELYGVSREKRRTTNDADRLRKYLARFHLDWGAVRTEQT